MDEFTQGQGSACEFAHNLVLILEAQPRLPQMNSDVAAPGPNYPQCSDDGVHSASLTPLPPPRSYERFVEQFAYVADE